MEMIRGTGRICYDPHRPDMARGTKWWCVATVDREITRYLRWFLNRELLNPLQIEQTGSLAKYPYVNLCQPAFDAHISIIRGRGDFFGGDPKPWQLKLWKKYQGKEMEFFYDTNVTMSKRQPDFWTMKVDAPQMLEIRKEMGLKSDWKLHITVGRTYLFGCKDEE
jgi:hypothetical protein